MNQEQYEKALRELKQQEYNEVYKVNLCFVCVNSLERPCFLCDNVRFTHKAACLVCLEREELDEYRVLAGTAEGQYCVNCTIRIIDRPCFLCNKIKLTVPACLRCCGELSEGEDEREDKYGNVRDKHTVLLSESQFKAWTIANWYNLGCFDDYDVETLLDFIDIMSVAIHYEWEDLLIKGDIAEEDKDKAKVLHTYNFPPVYCDRCNGLCVCYDPEDYPEFERKLAEEEEGQVYYSCM